MKFIVFIITLSFMLSCDRGSDFSMKFETNAKDGLYLSDSDMKAKFSAEEMKKVSALCEALSNKKTEAGKIMNFQTVRKDCEGKMIKDNIVVKIEDSGNHQYFSSEKMFPFYQDQTNTQGVIKDLCQQQTGQKVVSMSNHGGTVRYLFSFNKSCKSGRYCLEAGTVVKDYKNQKMKLVRKELFHIQETGVIVQRELVYLCKDEKTPFHYKATLK